MRTINGIPYYSSLSAAHRAGKRESERLKTMSYCIGRTGDEYALLTTDKQFEGMDTRAQSKLTQYFTYNNLEEKG